VAHRFAIDGKIWGPTPFVEREFTKASFSMRADGQRNRERILAAAVELVRRDGARVSLEEIARRAGVGSATLHRHFAARRDLLEVLFRDGVAALCARASAQPGADPGAELASWLEELTAYTATHRGLAAALVAGPDGLTAEEICCTDMVQGALDVLVKRAARSRALQRGVTTADLMALANAIASATENDAKGARRLVRLALAGIWTAPDGAKTARSSFDAPTTSRVDRNTPARRVRRGRAKK